MKEKKLVALLTSAALITSSITVPVHAEEMDAATDDMAVVFSEDTSDETSVSEEDVAEFFEDTSDETSVPEEETAAFFEDTSEQISVSEDFVTDDSALIFDEDIYLEELLSSEDADMLGEDIDIPADTEEDEWIAELVDEETTEMSDEDLQDELVVDEDESLVEVDMEEAFLAAAVGETFEADGITYKVLTEDTVQVGDGAKKLSGISGEVVIPEKVTADGGEYTVVKIGDKAFFYISDLTKITLPKTVTEIGKMAFTYDEGLKSITLPEGLTTIGDSAFSSSGLTSITLPGSLKNIGESVFNGNAGLKSVTIEDGVTEIGKKMFSYCEALTNVSLPASVATISDEAFANSSVKKVTIAEGSALNSIGTGAFRWCEYLTSINLPSSVQTIGEEAFNQCSQLTAIGLNDPNAALTYIGKKAFSSTAKLTSITIPSGCTQIGEDAFSGMDKLQEIIVGEGNANYKSVDGVLLSADGSLLYKYPSAKMDASYTTPAGVREIVGYAFYNTTNLEELTIADGVETIGAFTFQKSSVRKVTMADSVKTTGRLLFYNCSELAEVKLSAGLTRLENNTFYNTTSLTELTVPASITEIGSGVIYGSESMEKVTLEAMSLSLNSSAFSSGVSSLTKFVVQTNAIKNALMEQGIAEDNITSLALDPIKVDDFKTGGLFYKVLSQPVKNPDGTITNGTVQIGSGTGYSTDCDTTAFTDELIIPETVKGSDSEGAEYDFTVVGIAKNAFYSYFDPLTVKTLYIPDTVTFIGENAFYNARGLESVALPANINEIGSKAFQGCENIAEYSVRAGGNASYSTENGVLFNKDKSILMAYPLGKKDTAYEIPASVQDILTYAFSNAKYLQTVTGGANLVHIGDRSFATMSELRSVTLESLKTVDQMAFYNSKKLEQVSLPDNLTEIGKYMFYSCSDLTSITIPKSVTEIKDSAFYYSGITEIKIESTRNTAETIKITSGSVSSVTGADFVVAAESVKEKLVEAGVDEGSITVDETLMKDSYKESAFVKDGISYTVLSDPNEDTLGTVLVAKVTASAGTDVVIPENVEDYDNVYSVVELGESAIYDNHTAVSIRIPASVTRIGVNGISSNTELETIIFAENSSLTTLENGALCDNPKLKEIVIPASVTEMGTHVIAMNYSLTSVTFEEGSAITEIPRGTFQKNNAMKTAVLPAGIRQIGEEAFFNCKALEDIDLSQVTSIGENAFFNCASLTDVTLSDDLTELENGVFAGCTSLSSVTLGKGLTAIGSAGSPDAEDEPLGAFQDCISLTAITVPENVTAIGKDSFNGCNSLSDVTILSKQLDSLGTRTFDNIAEDAVFHVESNAAKELLEKATDQAFVVESKEVVVTLSQTAYIYNGHAQKPSVTVEKGGASLESDKYSVVYSNAESKDAGTYSVTVTLKEDSGKVYSEVYEIKKASLSKEDLVYATPSAAQMVYNGTEKKASVTFKSTNTSDMDGAEINVTYKDAKGSAVDAPVKAGTYDVYAAVAGGDNYESLSAQKIGTFTIKKASLSKEDLVYTAPSAAQLVYNGTEKKTSVTFKSTNTSDMNGAEINVTYKDAKGSAVTAPVKAGTYDVYAAIAGGENYESLSAQKIGTFTIKKASLSKEDLVYTAPSAAQLVYNGTEKKTSVTFKSTNTSDMDGAEINVTYKDAKGSAVAAPVKAGTYEVYAAVVGGENYESLSAQKMGSFTIKKAANTLKCKVSKKTVKKSAVKKKKQKITIKVKKNVSKGKLTFKNVSSKKLKKYITVSKKGVVTIKKGAPKGTYKIKVVSAATENYKAKRVTVTFKVK